MIEADTRDNSHQRVKHVGRVQTPSETNFYDRHLNLGTRKGRKCQNRHHLEWREVYACGLNPRTDRRDSFDYFRFTDASLTHANTLTEVDEVWRGKETGPITGGSKHCM